MTLDEAISVVQRALQCDDNEAHEALDVIVMALGALAEDE